MGMSFRRMLYRVAEYYVVISLAVYQSIRNNLLNGGYKPDTDYFYFCDCIVHEETDYYENVHGNKIIGRYEGMKFAFSGFNSVIQIGDNVKFHGGVVMGIVILHSSDRGKLKRIC